MSFRNWRSNRATFSRRWLGFELLERRDLLAVMRIANWNALNGPNDSTGDAYFQTVLEAIGNETVQGNTKSVDILALQETDPPGSGGDSIGRIVSILDTLYPSTNFSSVVTTEDGGGDSTGFVYDTSTVSLVEAVQVLTGSLTHNVMRGKFRPSETLGESDFYVYSIHLKSGTTGSDATTRGVEAAALRGDADALGEGALVLFVGDFNMQGSSEVAFTSFVSAGAGQLQDVASAPLGTWHDNPAYKNLHSQDPRRTPSDVPMGPGSGMDDRFDIQFATGEFFDGVGLEYVSNSYHVFGNNGTHTFDGWIGSGGATGAASNVLEALAAASDHLPVVADYEILVSTPNVRITQTLGGAKVVEGGLYDTYYAVLDTVPAASVNVTVTPDSQVDVGNGAGVNRILTFTPTNALTPQVVVVSAADDLLGEGDHSGLITHTSSSADAAYNGLSIAGVTVSIVDNDAPKIVINEIDADQTSNDMMEFVELYDGGVGNFSLTGFTVVFFNGATDNSYAAFDLTGQTTNSQGFFVLGNANVSPAPGVVFADNFLQNGADAVALYFGIAGAVANGTAVTDAIFTNKLKDAIVYDTDDADDTALVDALTPGQPQVNENQNNNGTTVSLSRIPDGGTPLQTTTYVPQTPTPGTYNQPPSPGVLIVQSAGRVDVAEGGATDSYQIALQTIPTDNVQITVDPDGQTDLGLGAGVAIALTFTPANALIPQTITVTATDDLAVEGVHTSVITHTVSSSDIAYNGFAVGNVVANIVDNDTSAPASIVITEIMYNPASDETSPGVGEWIEIVNAGTAAVDLSGWMFDDEDATNWGAISASTILNPGQIAVFFDSAFTNEATFRSEWSVPTGALVIGISWANLANSPSATNEVLQLLDNFGEQSDLVNYDDANPWPSAADGPSIYLKSLSLDNNNGANWVRSVVGVASAVSPTGATFSTSDVGSPGRFFLPGDYNLNGVVDAADYVLWRKNPTQFGGAGGYDVWRANFGAVGVPNGGLGSGSELAGGHENQGMAAAPLLSGPSTAAPAPGLPLAAPSIESRAVAGVAAVTVSDGDANPASTSAERTRHPSRRRAATIAADRADPLLSLVRSTSRPPRADAAFADHQTAADDHRAVVDQLFASLDDVRFFTGWREFSAI